ncbi:hypothetical protein HYQ45_012816 [Verticillium longisporum]|uniref:Uncharacterized protein n=1 Tax=Verticillium longisporum TaxID=100787 RepID=A0A8I3AMH5_VERLO|nr:hypothetical protein HYQ45_012816 [Verticillium longisporum]
MRWHILIAGVFAALVDSTPQYDLCAGYCSIKAGYSSIPTSGQCSPETTYVTETVVETRTVTETENVATTVYEPTTERWDLEHRVVRDNILSGHDHYICLLTYARIWPLPGS